METQICSGLTTCTPPHCLHYNCHSHGNTKLQWSYYLHTITLSLKQLSLTCNHKFAVILLPAHCTPPHCLQNNCHSHGNTNLQWSYYLHTTTLSSKKLPLTWKNKFAVILLPAHHHTVCHSHGNTKLQWSYYLHTTTLSSKQLPLTWKHKTAVILLPAHHHTVFRTTATHMET